MSNTQHENVEDPLSEPNLLLQALLCLIVAFKGADTQLVRASAKEMQRDLGIALTELSYTTMAQFVCVSAAAPLWGMLADQGHLSRRTILVVGSFGQGLISILLVFTSGLASWICLRAVKGVFLASVAPISNSIVADLTAEQHRGKIFGRVQAALLVGMLLASLAFVPMAARQILGLQGWRVAFALTGCASLCMSVSIACLMKVPPCIVAIDGHNGSRALWHEVWTLASFMKLPTFGLMLLQNVFVKIPWGVLMYSGLYFQLAGVPDEQVGVLLATNAASGAMGNILGGYVADLFACRFGLHGRPLYAQITVACGLPLMYMLFRGVPAGSGGFWSYGVLLLVFGLVGSAAHSGTNLPILAHIVPAHNRSRVMAWSIAIGHSISGVIGPMGMSFLAENYFGYSFGNNPSQAIKSYKHHSTGHICLESLRFVTCLLARESNSDRCSPFFALPCDRASQLKYPLSSCRRTRSKHRERLEMGIDIRADASAAERPSRQICAPTSAMFVFGFVGSTSPP
mmetsp:Transcript_51418/g.165153  ORF Transcript_51418/g.165153 Transcript_51418/m.165153 type:complete len:514 (-) Transcript_51418:13-1554(-)